MFPPSLLFLLLPLIEIMGFVVVGGWIGLGWTILLVIATTLIGFSVLRLQGFLVLSQAQQNMREGKHPTLNTLQIAIFMFGGLLLIIPGFFTDLIGLLLLVPLFRNWLIKWLMRKGVVATSKPTQKHTNVIEGEWHRED